MDRRLFLRLGGGAVAAAMMPLQGCATSRSLPNITRASGPLHVMHDGTQFQTLPSQHRLVITKQTAKKVGGCGAAAGKLNYPIALTVIGELAYVLEVGNCRVQIFDTNGASVGLIGESELVYPFGITANGTDEILVGDSLNGRIVGFATSGGDMTRSFGQGTLSAPHGLVATGDTVLVADIGLRQVVELDGDGRIVKTFGDSWVCPRDVATDGESVFVADASAQEIAVLDRRSGKRVDSLPLEIAPTFVELGADGTLYVA